jgi:hypothetical protein
MMWTPIVIAIGLTIYCCYPRIKDKYLRWRGLQNSYEIGMDNMDKGSLPHIVRGKQNQQNTESSKHDTHVSSLREYVSSVFNRAPTAPNQPQRRESRDSTDSWIEKVENKHRRRQETPPPRMHHI